MMKTRTTSRRDRAGAILGIAALVGIGGIATTALFTDNATVTTDARTGTLSLEVGGSDSLKLQDISDTLYAPGRTETEIVPVENAGTIDATVGITAALALPDGADPGDDSVDILKDHLYADVVEVDANGDPIDMTAYPDYDVLTPYSNTLAHLGNIGHEFDLGAGDTRYLAVTVRMPSADELDDLGISLDQNEAKGKSVQVTLDVTAIQSD